MELVNLYDVIQKTLTQQGFKLSKLVRNSTTQSEFVLGDELDLRNISKSSEYKALYGNSLEVRICQHRNGSKQDTSYYLAIDEWNCSSSKDLKKIKLMRSQTEPTLVRKITKFALEYKSYITEQKLNKYLDELL